MVVNALVGAIQEGRAEAAIEGIRAMLAPRANVLRDGCHRSIAAEELVPGDIVLLESGDRTPADLRLMAARNLQVQEAILTGESVAIEKSAAHVDDDAALGDRRAMAYAGTFVTTGRGTGVVVATADATEIGKIGALVSQVQPLTTPLLRQRSRFGRVLTLAIAALAASTFAIGTLGRGLMPPRCSWRPSVSRWRPFPGVCRP